MIDAEMIAEALASGAAAGSLEFVGENVIKPVFAKLKELLQTRFPSVDTKPVEDKPKSEAKQKSLAEDLADVGADHDAEVRQVAQELIRLILDRRPEAAAAAGITVERLQAGLSIDLDAEGSARVTDVKAGGDIKIKLRSSGAGTSDPNA